MRKGWYPDPNGRVASLRLRAESGAEHRLHLANLIVLCSDDRVGQFDRVSKLAVILLGLGHLDPALMVLDHPLQPHSFERRPLCGPKVLPLLGAPHSRPFAIPLHLPTPIT